MMNLSSEPVDEQEMHGSLHFYFDAVMPALQVSVMIGRWHGLLKPNNLVIT